MPGSAVAERWAPQGGSRSTFLRQLYPHRPGRWPSRQKHVTSPGRNDPIRTLRDVALSVWTLGDGGLSARSPSRSPGPRQGSPRAGPRRPARHARRTHRGHLGDVALSVRLRTGARPELRQVRPAPHRLARPAPPGPRPAPRRRVCVRTPPESPDACARRADSGASRVLAGRLAACCYTDARKNRPHRGTRRRGDMRTRGAAPCCWQ